MSVLVAGFCLVQAASVTLASAADAAPRAAYVTGDGGLTVGIDETGTLVQLQWPSPGLWEQAGPEGRASWVMWNGATWAPFDPEGWRISSGYTSPDSLVLHTRFEETGGHRTADQRLFVWPGRDVLVVSLRLHGFDEATRLGWQQHLRPSTHVVTGMGDKPYGGLPAARPSLNYVVPARELLHVRQPDGEPNREPSGNGTHPAWLESAEGVFIASEPLSPPEPVGTPTVYEGSSDTGGLLEIRTDAGDDSHGAVVLIGAGDQLSSVRNAIRAAQRATFPTLLADAERSGRDWLRGATLRSDSGPVSSRTILNLLLCVDRDAGAVLRAPLSNPPAAYSTVLDTVYASAALDDLGFTDLAGRTLMHHVKSIRSQNNGGMPVGSLPAALYSDGRPARFTAAADPVSSAWLLAACWRHTTRLSPGGPQQFLEPIWPLLSQSADYLALAPDPMNMTYVAGQVPGHAADTLEARYLGLECARRMSEGVMEITVPGLRQDRRTELYARIRARRLNAGSDLVPSDSRVARWVAWLGPTLSQDQAWEPLVESDKSAMAISDPVVGIPDTVPAALRDATTCLTALAGQTRSSAVPLPATDSLE